MPVLIKSVRLLKMSLTFSRKVLNLPVEHIPRAWRAGGAAGSRNTLLSEIHQ